MDQDQNELLKKTDGRKLFVVMAEMLPKVSTDAEQSLSTTRNELAAVRAYLAYERTFMASIRTNAIFAGLSPLLTTNDQHIASIFILCLCILVNLYSTYNFYASLKRLNTNKFNFFLLFNTAGYNIGRGYAFV